MHQYPSDISREEYKLIREDLEGAKKNLYFNNDMCYNEEKNRLLKSLQNLSASGNF